MYFGKAWAREKIWSEKYSRYKYMFRCACYDLDIWPRNLVEGLSDPLRDRNSEARAATNVFPSQYHKMNTVLFNVDSNRYVIYMIIKQITH